MNSVPNREGDYHIGRIFPQCPPPVLRLKLGRISPSGGTSNAKRDARMRELITRHIPQAVA
jgi:hypothetical protein